MEQNLNIQDGIKILDKLYKKVINDKLFVYTIKDNYHALRYKKSYYTDTLSNVLIKYKNINHIGVMVEPIYKTALNLLIETSSNAELVFDNIPIKIYTPEQFNKKLDIYCDQHGVDLFMYKAHFFDILIKYNNYNIEFLRFNKIKYPKN